MFMTDGEPNGDTRAFSFPKPGQALLRSPRGQNASRDGLVKLGWVHCLQYTLNCFQYNVCGLGRCEPSNQKDIEEKCFASGIVASESIL